MKALRVLAVDDDKRFLNFLERTLKRAGFAVLTASDGCEVQELLSTSHIDLLIMDLQMPGMNGWEVLRLVRDESAFRVPHGRVRPRIIVVSGRHEDETAAFVRRLGADAYLTKPLLGAQLLATVRGVLASAATDSATLT
ncbi:MAG TPA: response regulator transcription factor [Candidatus Kryptonia bacterium]|nr:response regulator transcription factor [Candidatus Kryptonia bacterium]